jgi:hypothetical protein
VQDRLRDVDAQLPYAIPTEALVTEISGSCPVKATKDGGMRPGVAQTVQPFLERIATVARHVMPQFVHRPTPSSL